MLARIAWLYIGTTLRSFDFAGLERMMNRFGAKLYFPATSEVTSFDDDGIQRRRSRAEFEEQFSSSNEFSFQWWITDSDDVYCRLRELSGCTVVELGLNGMDDAQEASIVEGLLAYGEKLAQEDLLLGIAIDLSGYEYEWDDVFVNQEYYLSELPDILGIPEKTAGEFPFRNWPFEKRGRLVVFRAAGNDSGRGKGDILGFDR